MPRQHEIYQRMREIAGQLKALNTPQTDTLSLQLTAEIQMLDPGHDPPGIRERDPQK